MIATVLLVASGVTLAVAGPWIIRAGQWADRAPRLAIAAWSTLSSATVASVVLAAATLVVPVNAWPLDLAGPLDACVMMIQAAYLTPGGALAVTGGLAVLTIVAVRLALGVGRQLWTAGRERRRHGRTCRWHSSTEKPDPSFKPPADFEFQPGE